jgi:acetyl-CoA synthetase
MASPEPIDATLQSWADVASALRWYSPWDRVWDAAPPAGTWFPGGRLNLAANCLDRHLPARADDVALYWEGEPGDSREITYGELHREVVALVRALRSMGVGPADRVALHLGWIPETAVALLACARIGAVCTSLPTPLPVDGLTERLVDFSPKVVFTQDGAWRRGAILPLKARADEALSAAETVEHTVVVRRTGVDITWYEGDRWYHELISEARPGAGRTEEPAEPLPSDHPLLVSHLVNRKGRPVSIVHSTANVLVSASAIHRHGVRAGRVLWLPGDASWLATQIHGLYGPLSNGDATVMFEGVLDTPTHERAWQVLERYDVSTVLLSPSVARALREWSDEFEPSRLESLRRCVTFGEAQDRDLAEWLATGLARQPLSVADAWGQVELGGIVAVEPPQSPTALPDVGLSVVDAQGDPVPPGKSGELVLTRPWPGTATAVFGEAADEVVHEHWGAYPGAYATGDLAHRTAMGWDYLGRRDQVVSVSGHRVSLTEVQEVLLDHPYVRSADVVEFHRRGSGPAVAAAVVLDRALTEGRDLVSLATEILDGVRDALGGLARPRSLMLLDHAGDEIGARDRRTALAVLADNAATSGAQEISWSQVLAAAGYQPGPG